MKKLIEAYIKDKCKCLPPVEMTKVSKFIDHSSGEQCYEALYKGYSTYDTVVTNTELLGFMWSKIK